MSGASWLYNKGNQIANYSIWHAGSKDKGTPGANVNQNPTTDNASADSNSQKVDRSAEIAARAGKYLRNAGK